MLIKLKSSPFLSIQRLSLFLQVQVPQSGWAQQAAEHSSLLSVAKSSISVPLYHPFLMFQMQLSTQSIITHFYHVQINPIDYYLSNQYFYLPGISVAFEIVFGFSEFRILLCSPFSLSHGRKKYII